MKIEITQKGSGRVYQDLGLRHVGDTITVDREVGEQYIRQGFARQVFTKRPVKRGTLHESAKTEGSGIGSEDKGVG